MRWRKKLPAKCWRSGRVFGGVESRRNSCVVLQCQPWTLVFGNRQLAFAFFQRPHNLSRNNFSQKKHSLAGVLQMYEKLSFQIFIAQKIINFQLFPCYFTYKIWKTFLCHSSLFFLLFLFNSVALFVCIVHQTCRLSTQICQKNDRERLALESIQD